MFIDNHATLEKIHAESRGKDIMSEIKIPTIEETLAADAYEARMHFLYSDGSLSGKYVTVPGQVSEPTPRAAQDELPYNQPSALLMWVDFAKAELTGTVETPHGLRRTTTRRRVGEIAIATYPGEFASLSEVVPNTFLRHWIGRYAMDRSRGSFGELRHPIFDIYDLYQTLDIDAGLAAVEKQLILDGHDGRIDPRKEFIAQLELAARQDFPELFRV